LASRDWFHWVGPNGIGDAVPALLLTYESFVAEPSDDEDAHDGDEAVKEIDDCRPQEGVGVEVRDAAEVCADVVVGRAAAVPQHVLDGGAGRGRLAGPQGCVLRHAVEDLGVPHHQAVDAVKRSLRKRCGTRYIKLMPVRQIAAAVAFSAYSSSRAEY